MKHDVPQSYIQAQGVCSALGVGLSEDSYTKILRFLDLLQVRAKKLNLVGPAEVERLWTRHVLESLAFIPFLHKQEVVDIGTGAGFPGLILSLCGFDVTMVESRGKRCAFLETAARNCGIKCKIINKRIEEAGPFPAHTLFTSRAVKEPLKMLDLIIPAAPDGFTLVTRVSAQDETCYNAVISDELPNPPLDRKGFILQYRYPSIKN